MSAPESSENPRDPPPSRASLNQLGGRFQLPLLALLPPLRFLIVLRFRADPTDLSLILQTLVSEQRLGGRGEEGGDDSRPGAGNGRPGSLTRQLPEQADVCACGLRAKQPRRAAG